MSKKVVHGMAFRRSSGKFEVACGVAGKNLNRTYPIPDIIEEVRKMVEQPGVKKVFLRPEQHFREVTCQNCILLSDPGRRKTRASKARATRLAKYKTKPKKTKEPKKQPPNPPSVTLRPVPAEEFTPGRFRNLPGPDISGVEAVMIVLLLLLFIMVGANVLLNVIKMWG